MKVPFTPRTAKRISFVFLSSVIVCILLYLSGCSRVFLKTIDVEQLSIDEPWQAQSEPEQHKVVFAAYNIAHGRGLELGASNWDADAEERQKRLTGIGELLAELNVDIVVLNEVDFDANWSDRVDQAAEIARAGGFEYVARQPNYLVRVPWFSLDFGNAVLSKYPIVQAERIPLPPMKKLEALTYGNHDALLAKVKVGSRVIDVWALHLEVRSKETRMEAVKEIYSRMDLDRPSVILGDLNSQPSTGEQTSALDELVNLSGFDLYPSLLNPDKTFPAESPDRTLDWVLFSPDITLMEGQVISVDYSDHLPVIVGLEISD